MTPPVPTGDPLVLLEEVALTLASAAGPVDILRGISLAIEPGETVALLGPSGSGKSSLLMVLAGLERPSRGRVRLAGHDLGALDENALARLRRRHIGVVFQSFHLLPTMTALENVAIPLELAGERNAMAAAGAALARVGLGHRLGHYPGQLSGGEQQRVAIARAFVAGPALLLADEPTGNLDGATGRAVIDCLFEEHAKRGSALLLITHDAGLAERCDRQLQLADGRIVGERAARQLRRSLSAPGGGEGWGEVGDSRGVADPHLTLPRLWRGPLPLPPEGRRGPRRAAITKYSYALCLARRELRGGIAGFRIFLACLVLGVGAIAAIGSLGAAVEGGIRADARTLLGGDVSARLAYRPANEAEHQFLAASGTLSETAKLRAMARSLDGDRRSLIELQAVDDAYPLYGRVGLMPAQELGAALMPDDGVYGAVVEAPVASRLGLSPGAEFRIGDAVLRLSAIIENQPDAAFGGLAFGPRVIIPQAALDETRLIRPGALVNYEYRLRLPPATDPAGWIGSARAAFPQAGWQLRSGADASPVLQRFIDRVGFFLSLVGITALLVGGVGIGNAVAGYVASKTVSIATLKCLGASTRLVFTAYLVQILTLALGGIAAGLLLGGVMPALLAPLVEGLLPVPLRLAIYPAPLAIAGLCGLLTTLVFALWPLAAIGQVTPAALFRDRVAPTARDVAPLAAAASALAALALAGLVVLSASDRTYALWYVGGAFAAFLLFRLAGALIVAAARLLPRPRWPLLRLALANLHRPGAPTARIVLSLGIGLSVMSAVALVEGNLAVEIDSRLAEHAPADFFIDIQPDQLGGFEAIVRATPGASFDQVPMLRGRITRLNGTPVEAARVAPQAQWALRSDRGLTYAAALPAGSRLVAGTWWPADYHGPPLVSFDAELARGMGLGVGDTLTVNLLGRDITARIASLRRIDWARLSINFAMVFAPGTLEAAPQTHLAAVYIAPAGEEGLVRRVTERFPNLSAIPVREALAAVARVVGTIGSAIRLVALVTLAAGILVLGGAVAAGHRRRVYDAVVLKVLGATRGALAASFLIEHGLVGLLTAGVAAGLGTLAAYALVTGPMKTEWVFLPGPLLATAGIGVLLTLLLGFAGTWRALGARPARYLRDE